MCANYNLRGNPNASVTKSLLKMFTLVASEDCRNFGLDCFSTEERQCL